MNNTDNIAIIRQSPIVSIPGLHPARVVLARNRATDQYFTCLEIHKPGRGPERLAFNKELPSIREASRDFDVRRTALEGA